MLYVTQLAFTAYTTLFVLSLRVHTHEQRTPIFAGSLLCISSHMQAGAQLFAILSLSLYKHRQSISVSFCV